MLKIPSTLGVGGGVGTLLLRRYWLSVALFVAIALFGGPPDDSTNYHATMVTLMNENAAVRPLVEQRPSMTPNCGVVEQIQPSAPQRHHDDVVGGIDGLNRFLLSSRERALSLLRNGNAGDEDSSSAANNNSLVVFSLYMGNEASDLDSMVSSIVLAYHRWHSARQLLRHHHHPRNESDDGVGRVTLDVEHVILPLINIPRRDLVLRPEALWLFNAVGLDVNQLVFADEVDLDGESIATHRSLRGAIVQVHLVDHNALARSQLHMGPHVVEVIDHHHLSHHYGLPPHRLVVEMVGSTATLVAEEIASTTPPDGGVLDAHTSRLLAGTILIDTVGLSPSSGRTSAKDVRMVEWLEPMFRHLTSVQHLFCSIESVKYAVSDLSTRDMLRQDYKQWSTNEGVRLGISSVTRDIIGWAACGRGDFYHAIHRWMDERSIDVLLVMTMFHPSASSSEWAKQVAVITREKDRALFHRVNEFLAAKDVDLELSPMTEMGDECHEEGIAFQGYVQGNLLATRKVYHPLLAHGLFS